MNQMRWPHSKGLLLSNLLLCQEYIYTTSKARHNKPVSIIPSWPPLAIRYGRHKLWINNQKSSCVEKPTYSIQLYYGIIDQVIPMVKLPNGQLSLIHISCSRMIQIRVEQVTRAPQIRVQYVKQVLPVRVE